MVKAAFVDFARYYQDKHPVYALAACLKKQGVETSHIFKRDFARTLEEIRRIKPDLLLYSSFSRDLGLFEKFDRFVKKHVRVSSIIGGPGPTFDWAFFKNSSIDALCIGEGESALADYIRNGLVPSTNILTHATEATPPFAPYASLDDLPFPDRDIVYAHDYVLRKNPSKQFLSGRGCPYRCTYCHNNIRNNLFRHCGPIVRKKSVEYLLEEIRLVQNKYPLSTVIFNDDTFILNKKWAFEFCEKFPRKIGLPFTCYIRADLVDEDIVRALKEGNCASTYYSIESGNDVIRNTVLKRQMSREQILDTARLLHKYSIPFRCGAMLGLPDETHEQRLETLALNIEVKPDLGFAYIFHPYPGLELTNYALERGHLDESALQRIPRHFHKHSVLNFPRRENERIQKLSYLYPFCVRFPVLFYNRRLFNLLLMMPKVLIYAVSEIFSGYLMTKVYRIKTDVTLMCAILLRFLKNPY